MNDCTCNHSSDNSGFSAGLMLGLIMGGAGGYLLSTEKGQELLAKLKEDGGEKVKEFLENPNIEGKLSELEGVMEQARRVVNDSASRLEKATEKPEPKKNFFQKHGLKLGK